MLLYEAAEDVPQLLGKEFRDAIATIPVPPERLRIINAVSGDLNKFWQTHQEFLRQIRNALVAHREQDGRGRIKHANEDSAIGRDNVLIK